MKWPMGSQSWRQAGVCRSGSEDGRSWPKDALLHPMDSGGRSESLLQHDEERGDLAASETRLQKVARLGVAIQRREYYVPAEDLAERLLVALFGRSN